MDDITEIEVSVQPKFLKILFHHNPQTPLEAKFSMEFCVSAALVFGKLKIAQFSDECLVDPQVRDLMHKVKVIPNDELKSISRQRGILAPAQMKVKLRDGEELCETVWEAKGGSSNPMTPDEIREKFRECANRALPALGVERVLDTIEHLESVEDISDLTSAINSHSHKNE
jgi:2-methylcitrate dehydratase PrpD